MGRIYCMENEMMRCCCCIEDCILDCRVNRMNEKLVETCCSKVDWSVFFYNGRSELGKVES